MKNFKTIILGVILSFMIVCFGCSPAGVETGLVGTWTAYNESFNVPGFGNETAEITLIIYSGDTGSYASAYTGFTTTTITFGFKIIKGDSIYKTISIEYTSSKSSYLIGLKKTYTYSLTGNKLKIFGLEIWNDGAGNTVSKDATFIKTNLK